MPYLRTVKTKSGATAIQVVYSSRRGSRDIEHIGSAHDVAELEALKAAAHQRMARGQLELGLGLEAARQAAGNGPMPITSSRMGHLLDALERAYRLLGLDDAARGDEVFRRLVLARIIEPTSKLDSIRVLEEAGVTPASYRTIARRLPAYAQEECRQRLSAACAAHARLSPASLVLYDVSTLLCRRRHKRVYADLVVMPMCGGLRQVMAFCWFRKSAYSDEPILQVLVYLEVVLCDLFTLARREVRLRARSGICVNGCRPGDMRLGRSRRLSAWCCG